MGLGGLMLGGFGSLRSECGWVGGSWLGLMLYGDDNLRLMTPRPHETRMTFSPPPVISGPSTHLCILASLTPVHTSFLTYHSGIPYPSHSAINQPQSSSHIKVAFSRILISIHIYIPFHSHHHPTRVCCHLLSLHTYTDPHVPISSRLTPFFISTTFVPPVVA
jgi:hypothetical protein